MCIKIDLEFMIMLLIVIHRMAEVRVTKIIRRMA